MILLNELKTGIGDKTLQCKSMLREDARANMLELLPNEIQLSIRRSNISNEDMFNIVSRCLDFQNGIEKLIIAVYHIEGESNQWYELRKYVRDNFAAVAQYQKHSVPEVVFCTYIEQQYLLDKTKDIALTIDELKKAYFASIPSDRQKLLQYSTSREMLEWILKDLTKHGLLQGKIHPLLKFVEWLAFYAEKDGQREIRDKLQYWIEWSADLSLLKGNQLVTFRDKIRQKNVVTDNSQNSASPSYLLIELFDDEAIPNKKIRVEMRKYSVRSWVFDDKHKRGRQVSSEIKGKITEIEASIGGLLDRCPFNNPIIEFLVPDELLSYEFDYWRITTNEGVFTLGLKYRVVVRSAKRLTNVANRLRTMKDMQKGMPFPIRMRECLGDWQIKWDHFQKFEQQEHSEDLACTCGSQSCKLTAPRSQNNALCAVLFCAREECQKQDSLQAALLKSTIVCLAVGHPPSLDSVNKRTTKFPLFETLLVTGMPIALWPRNGVDTELLISSLSYFPLSELPNKVMEWRRNAVETREERALGRHLTLLWDDPSRLPPYLTQPNCKAPAKGV